MGHLKGREQDFCRKHRKSPQYPQIDIACHNTSATVEGVLVLFQKKRAIFLDKHDEKKSEQEVNKNNEDVMNKVGQGKEG
jgi:hypothetical protein